MSQGPKCVRAILSGKNERQLDSAQNSDLDDKRIKLSGQKVPFTTVDFSE